MKQSLTVIGVSMAALLPIAGCGKTDYALANVSGRVTRGGVSVANATVTFQPMAGSRENPYPGPGSYGKTDTEGRFTLRTFDADVLGAVVGRHRVTITQSANLELSDAAGAGVSPDIPSKFHDGSLVIEVPSAGLDDADFDFSRP